MVTFSWAKEVLDQKYPNASWAQGVDLNKDGKIQPNEKIKDFDKDGVAGSPGDWEKFRQKNAKALQKNIAFFRAAAESGLKPDNPIHDILAIEAELVTDAQIQGVYTFLASSLKFKDLYKVGARDHLMAAFERTHRFGFVYAYDVMLFSQGIDLNRLDCDTFSFYVLAIGHELRWPVRVFNVAGFNKTPWHTDLRWDNPDGTHLNFNIGDFRSDEYYEKVYQVSRSKSYPQFLDRRMLQGMAYFNRAFEKIRLKRRQEAVADLDQAIALNPKDSNAYNARGLLRQELGGNNASHRALEDYDRAIALNPNHTSAFTNKGQFLLDQQNYQEVIRLLEPQLKIHPDNRDFHQLVGLSYLKLGDVVRAQMHLRNAKP